MPDLTAISTLFALFAAYGRERKTNLSEQDTEEFRRRVIEFMEQLDEEVRDLPVDVLATFQEKLTRQNASLARIEEVLDEIADQIGVSTSSGIWEQLTDEERALLEFLSRNHVGDWGVEAIDIEDVCESFGMQRSEILRSVRHLDEHGTADLLDSSESYSVQITDAGLLLEWKSRNETKAEHSVRKINDCLANISANETERVATIAQKSGVALAIASAYIKALKEMKLLRFDPIDGPLGNDILWSVSETLKREPPPLAQVITFALKSA